MESDVEGVDVDQSTGAGWRDEAAAARSTSRFA